MCLLHAALQNLTVVRIFGFPVQEGFNLQTAPGVYNETAFIGAASPAPPILIAG